MGEEEMKVEVLIYSYLAICAAMIVFNIVCIFVFQRKEKTLVKRSINFADSIMPQLDKDAVDEEHQAFLRKKLKKINYLMAFDETLETLYAERPEQVRKYLANLCPVFVFLALQYGKKDRVQAAYFPYIIKKYSVFRGVCVTLVVESLMTLVKDQNLYCRENALQALYSIGNADSVIQALKTLDKGGNFHHGKMIADGLLSFEGNKNVLDSMLWENFAKFSLTLRQPILDYFRFSSDEHCEKMLQIMTDETEEHELRFSAIRYFAKYRYAPALPYLYAFAESDSPAWEYRAIVASALGTYPAKETEELLKELLCDRNWYVRYNAADSLERLGVRYEEMIDIFEGRDRYAAEMLRYHLDRKKLKETEVAGVC